LGPELVTRGCRYGIANDPVKIGQDQEIADGVKIVAEEELIVRKGHNH
jgi:hypothetical protein